MLWRRAARPAAVQWKASDAGEGGGSMASARRTQDEEDADGDGELWSCGDLFAGGSAGGVGCEVGREDDEADWEAVRWSSGDADFPEVLIHRHLAQCWPSARLLAEWLLGPGRSFVQGAALVVELGASLGLPSLAASAAGAGRCVATDLYPSGSAEALEATIARNRRALNKPELFGNVFGQSLNWFGAPAELGNDLRGTADVVLCADVIYERRAAPAIAATAEAVLRPGGSLVFASRYGRVGLDLFLKTAVSPRVAADERECAGLLLRQESQLQSPAQGLGLSEEDLHGLWWFEKPGG